MFATARSNVDQSAAEVLRLARDPGARQRFLSDALRLTIAKADEVHYYKYLAALIDDIPLASPEWQPHLVNATLYYMKRSGDPEPDSIKRARQAQTASAD